MQGGVSMTLTSTAVAAVADGQLLARANVAQGPERDPALVVELVGTILLRKVQQSGSPNSKMDGQPSLAARRAWANLHGAMHGPTCIFWANLTPFSLWPLCAAAAPCAAWLRRSSTGGTQSGKAPESPRDRIAATPARTGGEVI